uniref:Uncharacterized protein n=1 Tax=viral metagenome TaxID=1070528 RepID=A0A6M3LJ04_9ZZZZ
MPEIKINTIVSKPLFVDVTGWLCCGRYRSCDRLEENNKYLICSTCGSIYSKIAPYKELDINQFSDRSDGSDGEPDGDRGAFSDHHHAPTPTSDWGGRWRE